MDGAGAAAHPEDGVCTSPGPSGASDGRCTWPTASVGARAAIRPTRSPVVRASISTRPSGSTGSNSGLDAIGTVGSSPVGGPPHTPRRGVVQLSGAAYGCTATNRVWNRSAAPGTTPRSTNRPSGPGRPIPPTTGGASRSDSSAPGSAPRWRMWSRVNTNRAGLRWPVTSPPRMPNIARSIGAVAHGSQVDASHAYSVITVPYDSAAWSTPS